MLLILIFYKEILTWFKNFFISIGEYVREALITILVLIEIISETKLFARFRTVCIFLASFSIFTWVAILLGKAPAEQVDFGLSLHQFCEKYGYTVQNETVKTEDGYFLTMHRIKCPKNKSVCGNQGPPILILHGFLGSSADFVIAKNQSLAFQLADRGYDVWLGNCRGNTYSRQHIMLDPNEDSYFWDFSFHEIGVIDLPAMIDHVLEKTNFAQLTYIGMSQGSIAFLVMGSVKPEYNKKIAVANLMAPVTLFYNTKHMLIKIWATFNFLIEWVSYYFGPYEIFGNTQIETDILRYFCLGPHKIANYVCVEQLLTHLVGFSDQKNNDLLPFHLSVNPAGASIKQFQHFVQNRVSGHFSQYNYYQSNHEIYKQDTPPIYNISKITIPIALYFGRGDILVNVEGLYKQVRSLPNVVLLYKVPYHEFNHMDFIFAKDLNLLVNNQLIQTVDDYNRKPQNKT